MEEILKKIKQYKSDPNKQEVQELMELLGELLNKKNDVSEIVDILLCFSPQVTRIFLNSHYETLINQKLLKNFLVKLRKSSQITPQAIPNRIFPIVGILVALDCQMPYVGLFFSDFLSKMEKKGKFTDNTLKLFDKLVLSDYKETPYDFLKLNYSSIDANLLKSLNRFVIGLAEAEMIDLANENLQEWASKYNVLLPKQKSKPSEQANTTTVSGKNPVSGKQTNATKVEKKSTDKSSQEKSSKDTTDPLPVPKKAPVVAPNEKKEIIATDEPKKNIENTKKESDLVKEKPSDQILENSVLLSEIQEAQKSLLATVAIAEKSMGKMSESLKDSLGMIDTQREEIAQLKMERTTLEAQKCDFDEKLKSTSQQLVDTSSELKALKQQITLLEGEVSSEKEAKQMLSDSNHEKTLQVEEQIAKITDLEQRLKKSLEQDAIAENQELITLKKELSRKLQEAHKDYVEMSGQDYTADLLESHKFLLERIFKMFKRQGITLEEEG